MSDERPAGERTVVTTVRGPSNYNPVATVGTSGTPGMRVTVGGLNRIAQELSGEYKVAVLNNYPNGFVSQSGFIPVLVSGSPVISGNVVNLQVYTVSGFGLSGALNIAEVSGANLSSLVVTVVAQGW